MNWPHKESKHNVRIPRSIHIEMERAALELFPVPPTRARVAYYLAWLHQAYRDGRLVEPKRRRHGKVPNGDRSGNPQGS